MTGPEHFDMAEKYLDRAAELPAGQNWEPIAAAQVHATLAQAAATERLAKAVENLPTYEGMLAVYTFGGGQ
ncbi:hypothetical protein [Nocardioides pakistanensis]